MTLASAKIRMKEAYRDGDWVVILTLILRFGSELIALLKELKAEKKKKKKEKLEDKEN